MVDLEHARVEVSGLFQLVTARVSVLASRVRVCRSTEYGAQEGSEHGPLGGLQPLGVLTQARVLHHGVHEATDRNLGRENGEKDEEYTCTG